jgi:hypothetical protein
VTPSPDQTQKCAPPAIDPEELPWDGFLEEVAIELDSEELEEE